MSPDAEPDVYVETCLGRVCDAIGIADEGKRASFPAAEIDVAWEDAPRTLRLLPTPPAPWPVLTAPPVVPPPIATVRSRGRSPSRPVHPAAVLLGFVALLAVGAAYVWSPTASASKVRAGAGALLGVVATR